MLGTAADTAVLIPLKSGVAWNIDYSFVIDFLTVLIPLKSGVAWNNIKRKALAVGEGLNPFEIRGGLKPDTESTVSVRFKS